MGFALGLPIVAATMMAALAYLDALPLAWAFLAVIVSAAATSVLMNQARVFMLAYNIKGKFRFTGVDVRKARYNDGRIGYAIYLMATNEADIPLEYKVTRHSGHLDSQVGLRDTNLKDATQLQARNSRGAGIMFVPLGEMNSKPMVVGEIEVDYEYGRVGKRSEQASQRFKVTFGTNLLGDVIGVHSSHLSG